MTEAEDDFTEFKFDSNEFCILRYQCVNYEPCEDCEGNCVHCELENIGDEGEEEVLNCLRFFKDFQSEKGLIIRLSKDWGLCGERIVWEIENYCCGTMKHFLYEPEISVANWGDSPIGVERPNPNPHEDKGEMALRIYRSYVAYRVFGHSEGKMIRFCPFCQKKVRIIGFIERKKDKKEMN